MAQPVARSISAGCKSQPCDGSARYWVGRVSRAKEYVFEDNDLTRFAPNLDIVEVPGDHTSMVLEPNVRVMAARLRAVIAKAEAEAAATGTPVQLAKAAE